MLVEALQALKDWCDSVMFATELAERRAMEGGLPNVPTSGNSLPTDLLEWWKALFRVGLHGWYGLLPPEQGDDRSARQTPWTPPLCILVHLGWERIQASEDMSRVVWIGPRCFPYPRVLVREAQRDCRLLDRSLFIMAREAAARLWATDLCLRCPAVGAVIADGSGFDMAATRRVQLLARSRSKPVFLARPPWERTELSAAQSRWLVGWQPADDSEQNVHGVNPRWSVKLLRCKGVPLDEDHKVWVLEWDRAQSALHLSAPLSRPAGDATLETTAPRHAAGSPREAPHRASA